MSFGTCSHPNIPQLSWVQSTPSVQLIEPWHTPITQLSKGEQRLPSSQKPPLSGAWSQKGVPLHVSIVQSWPSSQTTGVPTQTRKLQVSEWEQASPSSHGASLSSWTQP